MPHMELRGNTWFATLHVPKDVRETLGKSKLIQTLKTPDKRLAQERSLGILAEWKESIRSARGNTGNDSFTSDALKWREALKSKDESEEETIGLLITDKAEALEQTKDLDTAQAFANIALGYHTPIAPLIPTWEVSLASLAPKTKAVYVPTIRKLAARFKTLEAINSKSVRAWIITMQEEKLAGASIQRALGACTNFWRWLQARDLVDIDALPFKGHNIKVKSKSYIPFKPDEVVALWRMALDKEDQPLADLIQLGAYTGSRIEEICQLKVEHVTKLNSLLIPGTKTASAVREVPIHVSIQEAVQRLCSDSTDGFLVRSPAKNNRGNRSDPLSKSFGRLKGELGYAGDRTRVFHSIRKTLTTLLENAGVPEGVAADIVGHEKQTMTYGLYSSGNSLEVKREALSKVAYRGM